MKNANATFCHYRHDYSRFALTRSKVDWNAVRGIDRGRLITLKAQNKIRWEFVDATDDKLFCDEEWRPFRSADRLTIDRNDIREVRLELPEGYNVPVNACIGAAAGIAAGAIANAAHPHSGNDARFDLGFIGFLLGVRSGYKYHIVHGRVIYKR